MTEQHPVTPPPELLQEWLTQWLDSDLDGVYADWLAARSAQWGADGELEACRQWLEINGAPREFIDGLLAARRPKPPISKEEALAALNLLCEGPNPTAFVKCRDTITLALEQLEPEGATDEEIEQEALDNSDSDDEYRAFKSGAFFVKDRIGRPAIKPVPAPSREEDSNV